MKKLVIILFFSLSLNIPTQLLSSWATAAKVAAIPALWAANHLAKKLIESESDRFYRKKMQDAGFNFKKNQYGNYTFNTTKLSLLNRCSDRVKETKSSLEQVQKISDIYTIAVISSAGLSGALLFWGGLVKISVYSANKYLPGMYKTHTQGYIEQYMLPKVAHNERLDKFINGNMFTALTVLSFVPTITYTLCRAYNYYKLNQLTKKWQAEQAAQDLAAQLKQSSTPEDYFKNPFSDD